jgi:hypothetical protein
MIHRHLASVATVGVLIVAALIIAGVFPFLSQPANALVGTAGPITVTVTPAVDLSDGEPVAVHAEAASGVAIYAVTAHLCVAGAVKNNYDFSFQSKYCTNVAIGHGDVERTVTVPGAATADLDAFKVGVGTVQWTDERGFVHNLTCDPSSSCDLVARIEITDGAVFFRAPLCFGNACPAESTPTAAPSAAGPPPSTPTAVSSTAGSPTQASASPAPPPTGAAVSQGVTGLRNPSTSSSSSRSHQEGSQDTSLAVGRRAATARVASDEPSRGARVFVAAIAGALGGARIVSVVARTRRRASRLGVV